MKIVYVLAVHISYYLVTSNGNVLSERDGVPYVMEQEKNKNDQKERRSMTKKENRRGRLSQACK